MTLDPVIARLQRRVAEAKPIMLRIARKRRHVEMNPAELQLATFAKLNHSQSGVVGLAYDALVDEGKLIVSDDLLVCSQ